VTIFSSSADELSIQGGLLVFGVDENDFAAQPLFIFSAVGDFIDHARQASSI